MAEKAQEILDRALTYEPGQGVVITLADKASRDGFRQRLFSAMSVDTRLSKKVDDIASPHWGQHRWQDVRVAGIGDRKVWVGRCAPTRVGEVMTLEEAMKGGTDE